MSDSERPCVIGWRERVDLPDWKLRGVRAKIDTGARTSAIDVARFEHIDGDRIRFEVVSRTRPTRKTRWIEALPVRTSMVKPSHGELQERPVCLTRIRVGDVEKDIELSLVCRKGMLCRMLLGRTALGDDFLVDASRKYLITGKAARAAANDGTAS